MKVVLGTLKGKGEELATFLEPRIGTRPELSGDSIEIDDASVRAGVKPRHVKTYIKRFLYMNGVRKSYRVFVTGKELMVQEIELGEKKEEEGEEKEKKAPEKKEEAEEAKPEEPGAPKAEEEPPKEEAAEEKPKAKKGAPRKPRAAKKKAAAEES